MMAVHTAFSDRSSALLTVQTLLSELSSLHSKAEKLEAASSRVFGADRSRIRKVEELKETIKVTEDAKNVAIGEYERIKVSYLSFIFCIIFESLKHCIIFGKLGFDCSFILCC